MIVEHRRCRLCDRAELAARGHIGHRTLARCAHCGHLFAARYDTDALAAAYKEGYYASPDDPRIAAWNATHTAVWDGLCRSLERGRARFDSLLDVGAGTGGFLEAFRARHPRTALYAIESSPEARAALAARMPGLHFVGDDAEDLASVTRRFDAITLLQTLEHVDDPRSVCRAIHERLEPGGVLLVTVPNRRSFRALLRGAKDPFCMGNPTHLHFFSSGVLGALLRETGFARVQRLVELGGGAAGPWARAPQWLLRRLGLSSELRFLAIKQDPSRPASP